MKKRKATRATEGQPETWPMPAGFDLPDDVGLTIGNRIHRVKVSNRGMAVGGNVTAIQMVGEQVIDGDNHVSFGAPHAAPAQAQHPDPSQASRGVPRAPAPRLSPDEIAVASHLGEDVSPGAMAKALGVATAVVQARIRAIQAKLGCGRFMRPSGGG